MLIHNVSEAASTAYSELVNAYEYLYDDIGRIRDGGGDMYDRGNQVSALVSWFSWNASVHPDWQLQNITFCSSL